MIFHNACEEISERTGSVFVYLWKVIPDFICSKSCFCSFFEEEEMRSRERKKIKMVGDEMRVWN